jgi:hypothetical protein
MSMPVRKNPSAEIPPDQDQIAQDEADQTAVDRAETAQVEGDQPPPDQPQPDQALYQVQNDPAFPGPGAPEPIGPGAALRGADLERAASDKVRSHFEQAEQNLRDRGFRRQVPNMMWVKTAGLQPVPDGQGGFFQDGPMQVPVNDVYINRRIRDGSMVVINGGPDAGPVGVLMRETPAQQAPPETENDTE